MIIPTERREVAEEMDKLSEAMRRATVACIAGLREIVDLATLTVGDDEYDYFVQIPTADLYEIGQRVSNLECDVQERFGIKVTVLPIPT